MLRLPTLFDQKRTIACKKCGSDDVKRTNPVVFSLLYFPTLFFMKHVNYYCFECGDEWWAITLGS